MVESTVKDQSDKESIKTTVKVESPKIRRIITKVPRNWRRLFDKIKEWRQDHIAPVDTMGCDALAEKSSPSLFRYQTLVALQLSSQTKDPVVAEAMNRLKSHSKGLTIDSIIEMPDETLNEYIGKVGFHNRKTVYLKQTALILKDQYNGDIPKTVQEIQSLPGVGPKMAYLCLQVAWGENAGIGVDTHVHRISNRLGFVKTTKPEETRLALEDWLPREHWRELNHLLVGMGQLICKPVKPLCSECPINNLCPKVGTKNSSKKLK